MQNEVPIGGPAPGFQKDPGYDITMKPVNASVTVNFDGTTIAETNGAVWLHETRHHPVLYVPRTDVRGHRLQDTEYSTYCPFKGNASYWSVIDAGVEGQNLVWGYLEPFDEIADLAHFVAFYGDRVDINVNGKAIPRQGPGLLEQH